MAQVLKNVTFLAVKNKKKIPNFNISPGFSFYYECIAD